MKATWLVIIKAVTHTWILNSSSCPWLIQLLQWHTQTCQLTPFYRVTHDFILNLKFSQHSVHFTQFLVTWPNSIWWIPCLFLLKFKHLFWQLEENSSQMTYILWNLKKVYFNENQLQKKCGSPLSSHDISTVVYISHNF